MANKLRVNPTGCPGPVPGSQVWRCDGAACIYGPSQYDSCKQAIAERGYLLRISSDLVAEAAEAAALHTQTAQGQLEQARLELADEAEAHRRTATTLQTLVEMTQSEADEFANLYVRQTALLERRTEALTATAEHNDALVSENTALQQEVDVQCAHCAALLQEIAALRDERDYYRDRSAPPQDTLAEQEADIETTDGTGGVDITDGAGGDGDSVLDTGAADGTVSE